MQLQASFQSTSSHTCFYLFISWSWLSEDSDVVSAWREWKPAPSWPFPDKTGHPWFHWWFSRGTCWTGLTSITPKNLACIFWLILHAYHWYPCRIISAQMCTDTDAQITPWRGLEMLQDNIACTGNTFTNLLQCWNSPLNLSEYMQKLKKLYREWLTHYLWDIRCRIWGNFLLYNNMHCLVPLKWWMQGFESLS